MEKLEGFDSRNKTGFRLHLSAFGCRGPA